MKRKKITKTLAMLLAAAELLASCGEKNGSEKVGLTVTEDTFGKVESHKVKIFTLSNAQGMKARVSEYGAILTSLEIPDKNDKLEDVTLGYDTFEGWKTNTSYFGSTVGRYGNRIAGGKFSLDGVDYQLALNNDPGGIPCSLHGGKVGFDKVVWSGKSVRKEGAVGVELHYVSQDGEEGYPGTLTTKVTYWLTDENELIWEAAATTDKATPINLVHHSYWNLSGQAGKSINDEVLQIEADHYLPTDVGLIPTGEIAPVKGTPMDFTTATPIGERVNQDFQDLKFAKGYDHCWVLRDGKEVRLAATLHDPESGRVMEVFTNQPGIQFYGGNFLDGSVKGKGGVAYPHRSGLCLETQKFPDSPNQKDFPNSILRPGETYHHTMLLRFSVKK